MNPEEMLESYLEFPQTPAADQESPHSQTLHELGKRYRRLVQALSMLKRLGSVEAPGKRFDDVCREILEAITSEMGAASCSLFLMDEKNRRLSEHARLTPEEDNVRILTGENPSGLVFELGAGVVGEAAATGSAQRIEDLGEHGNEFSWVHADGYPARSLLCFPLAEEGHTVGVVVMTHPEAAFFGADAECALGLVAERVAHMLNMWRLRRRLQEAEKQNLRQLESLVEERSAELRRTNEELAREAAEHRRDNEALRRLAAAMKQAGEAIVVTDAQGMIEFVNPAFEQITGRRSDQAIGRAVDALDDSEQGACLRDLMRAVRAGRNWRGDVTTRAADDTPLSVEVSASPVLDDQGDIANAVLVIHDVTQERRLEAQLRQAQKMEAIGTLAGGIAHDFNNLLQILVGYLDLARLGLPPGNRLLGRLDQARTAASRAVDLVRQILTFSRKAEQERRSLKLQPLLKESMKLLRGSIPATIEVREQVASHCGPVLADSTQMQQVLMNLATNAYQAMRDAGGVFTVRLEEAAADLEILAVSAEGAPRACAHLMVSDTGPGIPAEILDRIFEPYFTTKRAGEGTGMGLATVHGIIKAHGGAIRVESAVGEGTTFHIYLPICQEESAASLDDAPDLRLLRGNEHILFVDDEEMIGLFAKEALEELGYRVTAHTNSRQALETFRASPEAYDLIITDQTMPGLTGVEFAGQVLDIRPKTPIILCTGYSESVNEEVARSRGVSEYFEKPVVIPELADAVRRLVGDRAGLVDAN